MSEALRLSGVTRTYGKGQHAVEVLHGVDLEIADRRTGGAGGAVRGGEIDAPPYRGASGHADGWRAWRSAGSP